MILNHNMIFYENKTSNGIEVPNNKNPITIHIK